MSDEADKSTDESKNGGATSEGPGGMVALDGTNYQISPTAFRAHYQVTTHQGTLLGLIEAVEGPAGRTFTARPATGAGMTQSLMMKIATAAAAAGFIK